MSEQLLEAVAPHAVAAAVQALERLQQAEQEIGTVLERELEEARYEAQLAARRYRAVDPDKRLVASELEARWEAALQRVQEIEARLAQRRAERAAADSPRDRQALFALARDLAALWNAESTEARIKQRIVRIVIREVLLDVDEDDYVLTIHWVGGGIRRCGSRAPGGCAAGGSRRQAPARWRCCASWPATGRTTSWPSR